MSIAKASAVVALLCAAGAQAAVVTVDPSTAGWLGFMNVFDLPSDGGAFRFPSAWGVADLRATFNDPAQQVTLLPNTIGDADPYWYIGGGGPGAAGNKIMEANLYQQVTGSLSGQTVTFEGTVVSNTLTSAHQASIFIRDFASDFSSVNEVIVPISATGNFSISLNTIADPTRNVQWGMQLKGVNVWVTDTAPFGNIVFGQIPTPGSVALAGVAGLFAMRRRRGR